MNKGIWKSQKGLWMLPDGSPAINPAPTLDYSADRASKVKDILKHYFTYLREAHEAAKGNPHKDYDFKEWNAKELVWQLGNTVSLAYIRSKVSAYVKRRAPDGKTFVSLGSGPRTLSKKEQKEADDQLYLELGLGDFLTDPAERKSRKKTTE